MKPEEVSVIRPDHDTTNSIIDDVPAFEPSYQPEQLPKLEVPNLDAGVQSLTASELAQVPTLLDQVVHEPVAPSSDAASEDATVFADTLEGDESESSAQVQPVQADQVWELFHARMDTLTADIQKLNDRLDQLEINSKV